MKMTKDWKSVSEVKEAVSKGERVFLTMEKSHELLTKWANETLDGGREEAKKLTFRILLQKLIRDTLKDGLPVALIYDEMTEITKDISPEVWEKFSHQELGIETK